jgi:hypothetical protein
VGDAEPRRPSRETPFMSDEPTITDGELKDAFDKASSAKLEEMHQSILTSISSAWLFSGWGRARRLEAERDGFQAATRLLRDTFWSLREDRAYEAAEDARVRALVREEVAVALATAETGERA